MHPETGYKLYIFCENRARDTPLRGVYIPHFDQISVLKISVLGVLYPYCCTDGGEIWLCQKPQNRPLSNLNNRRNTAG